MSYNEFEKKNKDGGMGGYGGRREKGEIINILIYYSLKSKRRKKQGNNVLM